MCGRRRWRRWRDAADAQRRVRLEAAPRGAPPRLVSGRPRAAIDWHGDTALPATRQRVAGWRRHPAAAAPTQPGGACRRPDQSLRRQRTDVGGCGDAGRAVPPPLLECHRVACHRVATIAHAAAGPRHAAEGQAPPQAPPCPGAACRRSRFLSRLGGAARAFAARGEPPSGSLLGAWRDATGATRACRPVGARGGLDRGPQGGGGSRSRRRASSHASPLGARRHGGYATC